MDKDSKGQRKFEDSGGGLLPAVEGHSLDRTEENFDCTTLRAASSAARADMATLLVL